MTSTFVVQTKAGRLFIVRTAESVAQAKEIVNARLNTFDAAVESWSLFVDVEELCFMPARLAPPQPLFPLPPTPQRRKPRSKR